ncbi:hypothetical protein [Rhodopila sp.]|uniref:hypothetical protein n=1 Tax=Rhodopila sp. TaxID=2480087 RepID=UPI003D133FA4
MAQEKPGNEHVFKRGERLGRRVSWSCGSGGEAEYGCGDEAGGGEEERPEAPIFLAEIQSG